MNELNGWWYLHTNGDLIYKPSNDACADIRDSDFAVALWPCYPTDRANAWRILVEAGAVGARHARIEELAKKWGCNDADGLIYAERIGALVSRDGDAWCATRGDFINLAESPAGFGSTILEALSALALSLGYKAAKMWGTDFDTLVAKSAPGPR